MNLKDQKRSSLTLQLNKLFYIVCFHSLSVLSSRGRGLKIAGGVIPPKASAPRVTR